MSQVDFPGSWSWNGLICPLCQDLGVLPLSRGREGKCIQEATLGERLRVRGDRSRPRSHCPHRPGAPVSIAMVPCCRKRCAVPGLRRNPGLVFPVLELPGPDSPATALRSRGNPSSPSRKVGSGLCVPQPTSSRPARLHGNAPGGATAVAKGQSGRIRRLPGYAHTARPTPPHPTPPPGPAFLACLPGNVPCSGTASAQALTPCLRALRRTWTPRRLPFPSCSPKRETKTQRLASSSGPRSHGT